MNYEVFSEPSVIFNISYEKVIKTRREEHENDSYYNN